MACPNDLVDLTVRFFIIQIVDLRLVSVPKVSLAVHVSRVSSRHVQSLRVRTPKKNLRGFVVRLATVTGKESDTWLPTISTVTV
jgi:hypothetical protein